MGNFISHIKKYIYSDSKTKLNSTYIENNICMKRMFTNINPRKKALVIGINYISNNKNNDDLQGCVNDANNIKYFLNKRCFFSKDQITSLMNEKASKRNIVKELNNIIDYSINNKYSEIWLSYSGHGTQKHSFFEKDNKSEVICPSDYKKSGYISDSFLQKEFVEKLDSTTKIFILTDCCNSGSNFNLPYHYENGSDIMREHNYKTKLCTIIKLSGCQDDQTSMDYFDFSEQEYQGALTNVFLKQNHYKSIFDNIIPINSSLKKQNFEQLPVISYTALECKEITLI